jgi:TP901 family phage tail tape measure protein
MSDINANIGVNFDTAQALAELKNLQRQLSQFHTSISRTSESAALAQKNLQTNLLNSVNATGNFIAQMGVIKTSTESFTHALENNKLSMREYFRYAGGASKTFGRLFTNEFNTIGRVAEERVKRLQTQYIKMGRDTTGAMKAMSIMPASLDMSSVSTKLQIAAQKQAIFNQLLKQGSTQLLNFGKNTQWAGRQLMVGFTIPLIAMGSAATKAFQDIESAAIKFKRVYGDLGTSEQETDAMLTQIRSIADSYTKYGVAVKDTIALAADAAAAGFANQDLIAQTTQATKLAVLGQIDHQQALETTISLQSAFGISADKLAGTIDFLNAVENQTVVSLDDITTAIPKVAPIIQQLGGDVKDLAFFMTAMKEGGVNASEGANALKSGLASLINPSTKASAMLSSVGINIKDIVEKDKGNLKKTVVDVANALDTLDPLTRARAIEQMFGKFQFARMSTLFDNINKGGTQSARVLDLMGLSASDLASITDKELGIQGASSLTKFRGAIEKLKSSLAPIGELFMKIFTPILESIGGLLDKFNGLSDGVKRTIGIIIGVVGGLGPIVLMTFGLLMNAFANGVKLFATLRAGYQRLTGGSVELGQQTQYLTMEQLDAAAAAHSLDQSHAKLIQTFNLEAGAVNSLRGAYSRATIAAQAFKLANPGMMSAAKPRKLAAGGVVRGPGTGTSDSIPAMVSNGEAIVPAKQTQKYGSLINGIIADNIPGFMSGRSVAYAHAQMPFAPGSAEYAKGIQIAGLEKLAAAFPEFIKVVSNLVIELPQDLNVAMKKGVDALKFESDYNSRQGKTITTAKLGGLDIGNSQNMIALQGLEDEIGQATVQLAKQKAAGGKVVVSDEMFAEATRKVIDKYKDVEGAAGRAARALDASSKQVGQVRVSAKKDQYMAGLESGEFVRSRTGKQTQNQIMYQGVNIGRESSSTPNSFYSGNPTSPTGSYKGKKKQAVLIAAAQDAAAYEAEVKAKTKDIYPTTRERQSPHPLASQDGRDDAIAYDSAVQKSIARNQRNVTRRGGVAAPIIAGGNIGNVGTSTEIKKTTTNLSGLNNKIMGASFGLTTLASMGSMSGGKLGNLSNQVMKYSGILFGLMSVTQLMTKQAFLNLTVERAKTASNAMRAVDIAAGGKTTGFMPILSKLMVGFRALLGPVGLITAGIGAGIIAYKLIAAAQERERMAIEGLADAMTLTTGKINILAGLLGQTATKRIGGSVISDVRSDATTRSKVETLKSDEDFQKEFKNDIKAFKSATKKEAMMGFKAIALDLSGQGFTKEAVDNYIQALAEESGKTDLLLGFRKIKLDTSTAEGQKEAQKLGNELSKNFDKAFKGGIKTVYSGGYGGRGGYVAPTSREDLTKEQEKQLKISSSGFGDILTNLGSQFSKQTIKAAEYKKQVNSLLAPIKNNAQGHKLLNGIIENTQAEFAGSMVKVKDYSAKMNLARAAVLGIEIPQKTLNGLYSENAAEVDKARIALEKYIATEVTDKKASMIKVPGDIVAPPEDSATPKATAKSNMIDNIKSIKNQADAYNKLRKAGVDAKTASEMASDSLIAADVAAGKIKAGTGEWAKFVKQLQAAQKKAKDADIALNAANAFTGLQQQTKDIESQIKAYNRLIKSGYSVEEAQNLINDVDMTNLINNPKYATLSYEELRAEINKNILAQEKLATTIDPFAGIKKNMDAASKNYDLMMEKFRIQEAKVRRQYQPAIDKAQKSVEEAQAAVDKVTSDYAAKLDPITERTSALNHDLSLIDHQAESINEKYDAQAEALEQVNKLNQDAIQQGKSRISIADALSQGDIAAAAQAVQDARAANASSNAQNQSDMLQRARQQELDGIKINGLTRKQIEQELWTLSQQQYSLELQRDAALKEANNKLTFANSELKKAQSTLDAQLKVIEDQRLAWDDAKLAIDEAQNGYDAMNTSLAQQLALVQAIIAAWAAAAAAKAAASEEDEETDSAPDPGLNETQKGILKTQSSAIQGMQKAGNTNGAEAATVKMMNSLAAVKPLASSDIVASRKMALGYLARGGMVPQYFAQGGGPKGTDTIPAYLTPGEYVINKKASRVFGPLLEAINTGNFPRFEVDRSRTFRTPTYNTGGSSGTVTPSVMPRNNPTTQSDNSNTVYNYSLSFNINGDKVNSSEIANTVMNRIRQLQDQQVKGQVRL